MRSTMSWSVPRGAYSSSRPWSTTSSPSAGSNGRVCAVRQNMTAATWLCSSFSVKYTWRALLRRTDDSSPPTQTQPTSSSSAPRIPAASSVTVRMRGLPGAPSAARPLTGSLDALRDRRALDLPAPQHLDGTVELRILARLALLHVRRHDISRVVRRVVDVGVRRAVVGLLVATGVLEVPGQIGLAQQRAGRVAGLRLLLAALVDDDVGF